MRLSHYLLVLLTLAFLPATARASITLSGDFDNVSTLAADGWVVTNNSNPVGPASWFQGDTLIFASHQGAGESYIAANAQSVLGDVGTISNWLITPNVSFNNGDVFSFYTRTRLGSDLPDRLQLLMSTSGVNFDVGTSATDVGVFTTLLEDINPSYGVGGYPEAWTQFNVTLSGLAGPTSGRFAFRYFVESAGATGGNSNFIGIDTVRLTAVPEPSSALVLLLGSLCLIRRRRI